MIGVHHAGALKFKQKWAEKPKNLANYGKETIGLRALRAHSGHGLAERQNRYSGAPHGAAPHQPPRLLRGRRSRHHLHGRRSGGRASAGCTSGENIRRERRHRRLRRLGHPHPQLPKRARGERRRGVQRQQAHQKAQSSPSPQRPLLPLRRRELRARGSSHSKGEERKERQNYCYAGDIRSHATLHRILTAIEWNLHPR